MPPAEATAIDLAGPLLELVRVAVVAVAVARQVEGQHPEVRGEGGGDVGPPVRVGAAAVHEDQPAPAPLAPGEVVDRGPLDLDHLVGERHRERPLEPGRGRRPRDRSRGRSVGPIAGPGPNLGAHGSPEPPRPTGAVRALAARDPLPVRARRAHRPRVRAADVRRAVEERDDLRHPRHDAARGDPVRAGGRRPAAARGVGGGGARRAGPAERAGTGGTARCSRSWSGSSRSRWWPGPRTCRGRRRSSSRCPPRWWAGW